jgi:anti-sigma regulatory factor (Ser/Thr protein kinase)
MEPCLQTLGKGGASIVSSGAAEQCGRTEAIRACGPAAFVHEALLYRDSVSYLAGTVPFLVEALSQGTPALVAVPRANGDLLRGELGHDAERIRILDMTIDGRNPSRIIPAVLHAFVEEHAGRPVAIIGEPIWPGRTEVEYPACVQHEALINTVFAKTGGAILCPYDTRGLEPEVLADAARTHPVLVVGGGRKQDSRMYTEPVEVVAHFNRPLVEPGPVVPVFAFHSIDDLLPLRGFVGKCALATGLTSDRVVDLQVAANELATNTIRHAGGNGSARVWVEGDHVVCDITDRGHIGDPLAGRIPPPVNSEGGRGLLLTNYLCDLVRVYSVPGVTTVRLYMRLS